jgi:hypothetical protein
MGGSKLKSGRAFADRSPLFYICRLTSDSVIISQPDDVPLSFGKVAMGFENGGSNSFDLEYIEMQGTRGEPVRNRRWNGVQRFAFHILPVPSAGFTRKPVAR